MAQEIRKLVTRNTETGATDVVTSTTSGTFVIPKGSDMIGMRPVAQDKLDAAAKEVDTHADP
jgi:hypothetical protein